MSSIKKLVSLLNAISATSGPRQGRGRFLCGWLLSKWFASSVGRYLSEEVIQQSHGGPLSLSGGLLEPTQDLNIGILIPKIILTHFGRN